MTLQQQATSDLVAQIHDALKLWHKDASHGSPLAHLRVVQSALSGGRVNLRLATNQVLLEALEQLEQELPDHAALLRKRFLDNKSAHTVCNEMNLASATLFKRQSRALEELAEIIQRMEHGAVEAATVLTKSYLPPPPYSYLVGVEPHLDHLERVVKEMAPAIVGVFGIGGIGKSSLAHRLAVRLTAEQSDFATAVWVSARRCAFHTAGFVQSLPSPALTSEDLVEELAHQLLPLSELPAPFSVERALPLLHQRFSRIRTLVVVDNLETLEDVGALLPALRRLAHPARFVLTSRHGLPGEPDVYPFTVPELSQEDALRLLRREALLCNVPALATAADENLRAIYDTVGGNPLALKLVVGQVALLPLDRVLGNLRRASGAAAEALYHYIYLGSWEQLNEAEREVLTTLVLFSQEGADLDTIGQRCEIQGPPLEQALARLVRLSLVNVSGDLFHRRYSVHRLTETFLREEVLQW